MLALADITSNAPEGTPMHSGDKSSDGVSTDCVVYCPYHLAKMLVGLG